MSKLSLKNNIISRYKETYETAIKLLKTFIAIPYQYITNVETNMFINRSINILSNFIELETITNEDIKIVKEIINIANQEKIFACYLLQIEKDFCNREFSKYLDNPENYVIPNLELFIENGEFLKLYIEYKIEQYNEEKSKKNQASEHNLSKTI